MSYEQEIQQGLIKSAKTQGMISSWSSQTNQDMIMEVLVGLHDFRGLSQPQWSCKAQIKAPENGEN